MNAPRNDDRPEWSTSMNEPTSEKVWRLADCRHWIDVPIRFNDMDRQGHANNAVYATLFEMGRVDIFYGPNGAVDTDSSFLSLREITIRFERELAWPDVVKVGTLISRLGTSSIVMQQVIVSGSEMAATARVVNVLVSRSNRRSCPLPDKLRFALSAYQG